MLTVQRSAIAAGRHICRTQRKVTVRPVGAAGWPDLPPSRTPAATQLPAVVRPYAYGPAKPSLAPVPLARTAATSADSGGVSGAGTQQHQQRGFGLLHISGDGACMFRAIAQGAQIAAHGKPMPPESEGGAAHNLRLKIVQELRNRREEMEPFLPGIAPDFDEYCKAMSHPMAWGGEPEMAMAVHVVQRPITVYHIQGGRLEPIVTYGDHLLGSVQPIHLLWSGAHYDLLMPS